MNNSSVIMETRNLSVGYDGKAVAEKIELSVRSGEILSLIGPNGAGKTTLLKTLVRQLTPVSGTVQLKEKDLQTYGTLELAKTMAVVFSNALQPERMTCREAVAAGRYPYTGRFGTLSEEDEKVITDVMKQVHVEDLQDRPFDAISDGQRQRVVLARALCQQPDIILLDEPTTFLDIRGKAEFLESLQELSRTEGLTVLLTLHEPDIARKVSDRVACIREHRLDRVGTPEELFDDGYIAQAFGMSLEEYDRWFAGD